MTLVTSHKPPPPIHNPDRWEIRLQQEDERCVDRYMTLR
jgi:hypothetical protein